MGRLALMRKALHTSNVERPPLGSGSFRNGARFGKSLPAPADRFRSDSVKKVFQQYRNSWIAVITIR